MTVGAGSEAYYSTIWGGEHIHIGLYEQEADCVVAASERVVERLGRQLEPLDASHQRSSTWGLVTEAPRVSWRVATAVTCWA